ncbi:YqhA family protein [Dethiosulfatarculus sandiegensis]|uniref:YqhA family protein n=1 Tax=Dethiosulfatarculus sandiegensis TaxID=1429043 RepID=A0A0D2GIX2_9BACT|nr:YqhA family protein [Dethiosulfatarculus sandiegensis]KIX14757.1 hypothetical protein X474_06340 [Dethiosulfatarculus sandiegensis]
MADQCSKEKTFMDKLAIGLFSLRHVAVIAVFCSMIGAVFLLGLGVLKTWLIVNSFFVDFSVSLAAVELIKVADTFLIGLALMIFAFGVFDLFVYKVSAVVCPAKPDWLTFRTIDDLKQVLAKIILVILLIAFFEFVLKTSSSLDEAWELLAIPVGMVLFAWAFKLLK